MYIEQIHLKKMHDGTIGRANELCRFLFGHKREDFLQKKCFQMVESIRNTSIITRRAYWKGKKQNMQKIKIVTDSTADLSQDVIERYDIHVIPLSISVNGQTYLDRIDIQPDEFIEEMLKSEELPKNITTCYGIIC